MLTIRFNANTQPNLPWRFRPESAVPCRCGSARRAWASTAPRTSSGTPVTGIATYNVTPEVVGKYFHKTACFCFDEQTLAAGQTADMPLSFWVDPKIGEDPNTRGIRTITISYTFFRSLDDAARSGALANAGEHVGRRRRHAARPRRRKRA